jgi:SAM-dependent methyltransferase
VSRQFGFDRGRPVDRFYIERFLQEHAADIHGRTLEIGDDAYTRAFGGGRVRHSDVLHVQDGHPAATIFGDLTDAPHIASQTFDCVICTQTLQLIYELRAAVATMQRILKPGGTLLATFPGISQLDDAGWAESWCWSLTPVSARRLFGEAFGEGQVEVAAHGNVLAVVCFLHGIATEELREDELVVADPAFPLLLTVRALKQ